MRQGLVERAATRCSGTPSPLFSRPINREISVMGAAPASVSPGGAFWHGRPGIQKVKARTPCIITPPVHVPEKDTMTQGCKPILIEVGPGELIDKITIL